MSSTHDHGEITKGITITDKVADVLMMGVKAFTEGEDFNDEMMYALADDLQEVFEKYKDNSVVLAAMLTCGFAALKRIGEIGENLIYVESVITEVTKAKD